MLLFFVHSGKFVVVSSSTVTTHCHHCLFFVLDGSLTTTRIRYNTDMTNKTNLTFRLATRADLSDIVRMLADDALGAEREAYQDPLPASYDAAFTAIDADPNQHLIVACLGEKIVGTLQLTFIPGLSYQGGWRALLESVRIDAPYRNRGFGKQLVSHAIAQSQARGCCLVQLATNKQRHDARRFYEQLGFQASHEGMKRFLS